MFLSRSRNSLAFSSRSRNSLAESKQIPVGAFSFGGEGVRGVPGLRMLGPAMAAFLNFQNGYG